MIYVLSGGGVDCIALLGAMRYLNHQPTHYVACSGGSVISALMIAGYTVEEILKLFSDDIFVKSVDVKKIDINKTLKEFGLYSIESVFDAIEALLDSKVGKQHTLASFYRKTKIDLTVVGSNVSTKKPVYFNHRTHGDMPLITCLRISSTIPLLFQAVKYKKDFYVDGGLYDIFPYKHARAKYDDTIVGICIQSYKDPVPICNVSDFLVNFSLSVIETLINNTTFQDDKNVYTINTSFTGADIVSFLNMSKEKRRLLLNSLMQEGCIQCEKIHLKRSLSDV